MSGVQMTLLASGSGGVNNVTGVLNDIRAGAGAIVNITLAAAGSINLTGNGASMTPANWYLGGTGAPTCYATNTVNSGSAPTGANSAALTPTSSNPAWGWSIAGVGTISANCTIRIYSDAAGANLLGTINYTVTAQRTS